MAAASRTATTGSAIIVAEHAAFMQGGVSIVAASRDRDNVPCLNRISGCRLSSDRRQVTLFLWRRQAQRLLAAARTSGAVAVVFTEPPTHRTIQLKGVVGRRTPIRRSDLALIRRYRRDFATALASLGYPETFANALTHGEPDDMTTLNFTPTAVFMQTPGPGAGEPLVLDP